MKKKIQIDPERSVRLTRFAAIAVGIIFGLSAAVLAGTAVFASNRASAEQARTKTIDSEIVAVKKVLDDARSKAAISIRTQSKAVADFQESVSNLAISHGCKLAEFIASTDFQPYLSRFTKQSESTGWSQVDTQITLTGPSRNVSEAIAKISDQPVPMEFSTVQITREKIETDGAKVKAKIQLHILVKSAGGAV